VAGGQSDSCAASALGMTTTAAVGAVLGMAALEATKLLTGHEWHEGDVALVEATAARL